jgi:hypothetical protein
MGWASKYIEALNNGETVSFRPRGNSMTPHIKSGQLCVVAPAKKEQLAIGDVVLCSVKGQQYLHLITAINGDRYRISNNHGHVNGWTRAIHGRLVSVSN